MYLDDAVTQGSPLVYLYFANAATIASFSKPSFSICGRIGTAQVILLPWLGGLNLEWLGEYLRRRLRTRSQDSFKAMRGWIDVSGWRSCRHPEDFALSIDSSGTRKGRRRSRVCPRGASLDFERFCGVNGGFQTSVYEGA